MGGTCTCRSLGRSRRGGSSYTWDDVSHTAAGPAATNAPPSMVPVITPSLIRPVSRSVQAVTDVLLVTCDHLPDGEPDAHQLDEALAEAGLSSRWVSWRDPSVDWSSGGVVAVRSTWDYTHRLEEFLAWSRRVPRLLNGAEVFAWNVDKRYLVELGDSGVPVVPTVSVDRREGLAAAVARFDGDVVVKPRVGAGGDGLAQDLDAAGEGPWVVQPLVESVRTEGEISVFLFGGEPSYQVRKVPAAGSLLVHEQYGGTTLPVHLTDEAVEVARAAVQAAEKLLGRRLHYARVDQMRYDGQLCVSELEATEPGLYLDVVPGNSAAFAALVKSAQIDPDRGLRRSTIDRT